MKLLRLHWPFGCVLAVGAVLRLLTWLAYQPALFYPDSADYLSNTGHVPMPGWHPPGYPLFLDVVNVGHHLAVVTAVQHILVLLDVVALYGLLLRLGCGRWLATVALTPVLLDAYQLQIEQYLLSEALFETLLVAAVLVAMWPDLRQRSLTTTLTPGRAVTVGGLLGLAAFVRTDGVALLLAYAAWLLWHLVARRAGAGAPAARRRLASAGLGLLAGVLPLVAVVLLNATGGNGPTLTTTGPDWLYGRVAGFADCSHASIPAAWRVLCPVQPLGHRPGPAWYAADKHSPERHWMHRTHDRATLQKFDLRVIEDQPLDYAGVVVHDFVSQFRPTRAEVPGTTIVTPWIYRTQVRPLDPTKPDPYVIVHNYGTGVPRVDVPLAKFLRGYQRWVYLPGPLCALALLLAVVALVRRRRDQRAPGLLLLVGSAVMLLLVPAALVAFDWRYVLPTLLLYPPAAALSWAMLRRPAGAVSAPRIMPSSRSSANTVPV